MSNIDEPRTQTSFSGPAERLHRPVFIVFLIGFAAAVLLTGLRSRVPENWRWLDGLFVVLAAATTLVSLARRLPVQNVTSVAALIALIAGAVEWLGAVSGVPFGEHTFTDNLGARIGDTLPWPIPLAWVVVVLTCRDVARLILRPWRQTARYGLWVVGLASALVVLLDLGIEPFATVVKHYWLWTPTASALNWHGAPWVNFLGAFVTTGFILVISTPWLINKRPVSQPPDYHPLVIWLLLNVLLIIGNAAHHLWLAAGVSLAVSTVVMIVARRAARN